MAGTVKTPDELVDVYTEWINTYPRCVMLIDPFRYAVRFYFEFIYFFKFALG